jgi:hypothetical protein
MTGSDARVPRRQVLVALATGIGAIAAGCRDTRQPPRPVPSSVTPPPPITSRPSATSSTTASAASRYQPAAGEVLTEAKRVAGRAAERLATYQDATAHRPVIAGLLPGGQDPAGLLRAAGPLLLAGGSSTGAVVYAQLGGLTPDAAAVLVVLRQRFRRADGQETVTTRTLDLRLRRARGRWLLEGLASTGGRPAARPSRLSSVARAVLDDPRIQLPDSARWDIHRGAIHPRLLATMRAMAERFPYAVTVLASGHPPNVFGTSRPSNHSAGRAVDVYRVDGTLVIHQAGRAGAAFQLASWLDRRGVSELGSPWVFAGDQGRSFTNTVHRDHLHIGFDRA